jgi:hypothetical protein
MGERRRKGPSGIALKQIGSFPPLLIVQKNPGMFRRFKNYFLTLLKNCHIFNELGLPTVPILQHTGNIIN